MTTKKCTRCNVEKDLEEFSPHKKGLYGRVAQCKQCKCELQKEKYWKNPELYKERARRYAKKDPEKTRKRYASWHFQEREKYPERLLLRRARRRAREKGLDFNITEEDCNIPDVCPILGIELKLNINNDGHSKDYSPALDRLDNSKGYIKGNVVVISQRANRIKNDSSLEELESIVNFLKEKCEHIHTRTK